VKRKGGASQRTDPYPNSFLGGMLVPAVEGLTKHENVTREGAQPRDGGPALAVTNTSSSGKEKTKIPHGQKGRKRCRRAEPQDQRLASTPYKAVNTMSQVTGPG